MRATYSEVEKRKKGEASLKAETVLAASKANPSDLSSMSAMLLSYVSSCLFKIDR